MNKNCIYRSKLNKTEQQYLLCTACQLSPKGKIQVPAQRWYKIAQKRKIQVANQSLHGSKVKLLCISGCLKSIKTVSTSIFSVSQPHWPDCSLVCYSVRRSMTAYPLVHVAHKRLSPNIPAGVCTHMCSTLIQKCRASTCEWFP